MSIKIISIIQKVPQYILKYQIMQNRPCQGPSWGMQNMVTGKFGEQIKENLLGKSKFATHGDILVFYAKLKYK